MRAPIALSKSKLLSFAQCPKRMWLETYSPELEEEPSAASQALLDTGERVGTIARTLYGRGAGHLVSFDRGLRAAIEQTRALIAAGGTSLFSRPRSTTTASACASTYSTAANRNRASSR